MTIARKDPAVPAVPPDGNRPGRGDVRSHGDLPHVAALPHRAELPHRPEPPDPAELLDRAEPPDRAELLRLVDTYCDTAPRATARVEEHGALDLFVANRGWPFYARPRLTRSTEPTADEVRAVVARQIELGVPQSIEWIHETAPTLATTARSAGLAVQLCPLLVLGSAVQARPAGGEVRLISADDAELGAVNAALDVAFGTPGTAVGDAGTALRDETLGTPSAGRRLEFTVDALRSGRTVRAGAFVEGAGAVGGGSHNPRGQVTEIVGVGVLPAYRRRGLAGAVAQMLARQALVSGMTTVFCGAESTEVARVYEHVGFHRVGTICVATGSPLP